MSLIWSFLSSLHWLKMLLLFWFAVLFKVWRDRKYQSHYRDKLVRITDLVKRTPLANTGGVVHDVFAVKEGMNANHH